MAELPLDTLHVVLAMAPLAMLLALILGLRLSAAEAAGVSFLLSLPIAIWAFEASLHTVAVAALKGVWDGLFILFVIWPALLLFETVENAGAFEVIRTGLERFTANRLVLVLILGWLFASFLQSVAGFGTPIAIIAPILIGVGVKPVMAVVIPLVGQAWANVFGSLGVPWLTLMRTVSLDDPRGAAVTAALLVWTANLLAGLLICWLFARWKGVRHGLLLVLVASLIHGGGQVVIAGMAPSVAALVPSAVALAVGSALALLPRYRNQDGLETEIMRQATEQEERKTPPGITFWKALVPYAVLLVFSLVALLVEPVRETLQRVSVGLGVPQTSTGFGVARQAEEAYGATSPLTHPGTYLLLAATTGYLLFRRLGAYGGSGVRAILSDVGHSALPASLSVLALLALSNVMDSSGMVPLLAEGVATIAPPGVYVAVANAVGALGTFMTSSTTASNILFGPLQTRAALHLGLDQTVVLGAQAAGAGAADAIAPANIALGTGTAKISGQEADVLERTLPWLFVTLVIMAVFALLLT